MHFEYKDKFYTLNYQIKEDSSIVYENSEVTDVYRSIMKLPELSTYVKNDSTVAFFDTDNDLMAHLENCSKINESQLKDWSFVMGGIGIKFYKEKNFKGEMLEITESYNDTKYSSMPEGWDNQVSSLKVNSLGKGGGIFAYSKENCVGKNVFFELHRNKNPDPNTHTGLWIDVNFDDLSKIYTGDGIFGFFRPTFDNDLSSFKVVIYNY